MRVWSLNYINDEGFGFPVRMFATEQLADEACEIAVTDTDRVHEIEEWEVESD